MDIRQQCVREHYGILLGIEQEWVVELVEANSVAKCIRHGRSGAKAKH